MDWAQMLGPRVQLRLKKKKKKSLFQKVATEKSVYDEVKIWIKQTNFTQKITQQQGKKEN